MSRPALACLATFAPLNAGLAGYLLPLAVLGSRTVMKSEGRGPVRGAGHRHARPPRRNAALWFGGILVVRSVPEPALLTLLASLSAAPGHPVTPVLHVAVRRIPPLAMAVLWMMLVNLYCRLHFRRKESLREALSSPVLVG